MVKLILLLSFFGTMGEVPIAGIVHPFEFQDIESCEAFVELDDWITKAEDGYHWSHYCGIPPETELL